VLSERVALCLFLAVNEGTGDFMIDTDGESLPEQAYTIAAASQKQ
jgi:hypothetical protein